MNLCADPARERCGSATVETMREQEAYVALNMVAGLGSVTVQRIVAALGSAEALFRASAHDLASIQGVGRVRAGLLTRELHGVDWQGEQRRAEELSVRLITPVDAGYPALLKEIHDPPLVLYVTGEWPERWPTCMAVVGTRRPTLYGRETARTLSFQLAQAGLPVISGLARGIDTEAHRGALNAGGRTVAVMGGALDCLYPESNRTLAREIVRQRGAVISEFPFGRKPDRTTFPMRNRIVSGMSHGVLVVEAAARSGALITADQALEQGRSVMAVPGRIDTPTARGCHQLIRRGARLVETLDDILEELQDLPTLRRVQVNEQPCEAPPLASLNDDERQIVESLGTEECSVDGIIRETGLSAARVSALLIGLEMKRQIRMLPGGFVGRWRSRGA